MLITIPVHDGFIQLPHIVGFIAVEKKLNVRAADRPEHAKTWNTHWVPSAVTVAGTTHALKFLVPEGMEEEVEDLNNSILGFEQAVKACEMVLAMVTNSLYHQQMEMAARQQAEQLGRTESGLVVPK